MPQQGPQQVQLPPGYLPLPVAPQLPVGEDPRRQEWFTRFKSHAATRRWLAAQPGQRDKADFHDGYPGSEFIAVMLDEHKGSLRDWMASRFPYNGRRYQLAEPAVRALELAFADPGSMSPYGRAFDMLGRQLLGLAFDEEAKAIGDPMYREATRDPRDLRVSMFSDALQQRLASQAKGARALRAAAAYDAWLVDPDGDAVMDGDAVWQQLALNQLSQLEQHLTLIACVARVLGKVQGRGSPRTVSVRKQRHTQRHAWR
jgi:hypothetical protein